MQLFKSEFGEIRELTKSGEPWFIAKDVCRILGIKNSRDALKLLDPDEKASVVLNDGSQNRNFQQ